VDGTGSGSCPMVDFGIGGDKTSGSERKEGRKEGRKGKKEERNHTTVVVNYVPGSVIRRR